MKKLTSLILALLLACLCGCGHSPTPEADPDYPVATNVDVEINHTDYFDDQWHDDFDYPDIVYEHYDPAIFTEYAKPVLDFAETGGTAEDFYQVEFNLWDELTYVNTLATVMDTWLDDDPADEYAQKESEYIWDVYYDVYDQYQQAMCAVASSRFSPMMTGVFADWQIEMFKNYDSDSADDVSELTIGEESLVRQYLQLASEEYLDATKILDVFIQLVELRREEAELYGYDSYIDYAYDSIYMRSYTPADAEKTRQLVKEYFVPIYSEYNERVADLTAPLYYSDDIDCSPDAILGAMGSCLPLMSDELSDALSYMEKYHLYDIGYSEKKANTGYTTYLYYSCQPYLFNSPAGTFSDYSDTFHEFGHFVNAYYSTKSLVFRVPDNDLCELQSQGMEIMMTKYYDDIFGESNGKTVLADTLTSMLTSVVDGAMYDDFLSRVYAEDDLTPERVLRLYKNVYADYGHTPYEYYEYEWMSIVHNFEYSFYYISYCMSAVPALELYADIQDSWDAALDTYLTVEAMNPEEYYFDEALNKAGLGDVFSETVCQDIAASLKTALAEAVGQ